MPLTTRPSATSRHGITRWRSIRRPARSIDEVGQQPQAVGAAPLGVELDAEQRRRGRRPRRTAGRARSCARTIVAARRRRPGRRRTSGRSRSRRRRRCPSNSGCSRDRSTWFQPMCGQRRRVLEPRRCGRAGRRASPRRPRRCPRTAAAARGRCPRNGRSAASQARIGSTRPRRSRRAIAGAAAPTPGTTSASAPRIASPSRTTRDLGADGRQRLLDADEVAGAVVDDGDRRGRARHPSAPLVDATPVAPRIELAGDAERPAERLERGLGEVVVVATGAAQVERGARRSGRTTRGHARRAGAAARRPARRGTAGR